MIFEVSNLLKNIVLTFGFTSFFIVFFSSVFFIISFFLRVLKLNGILIFFSGLFFFIFSSFLKNLFVQFLSMSLLLLFDLLLIYYIYLFFLYRRKKVELFSVTGDQIYPFEKSLLKIGAKNLPKNFPCIYFVLDFDLEESNNRLDHISSPIFDKDRYSFSIRHNFKQHGIFMLKDFLFIFRDIFGFSEFKLKINFFQKIKIEPVFLEAVKIPFPLDRGGNEIIKSMTKINSKDFFESRKYYPGDDARRINWNIFAHSGELHVRDVEKIPPKVGQIYILFAPYSKNLYEYEYITSLFLSTIYFLLKYEYQLKILSPISNKAFLIDANSEEDFNKIINYSYMPYEHGYVKQKESIVFASFGEYIRLFSNKVLMNSHCAVSFYENHRKKNNILRLLWRIGLFDNLFKEVANELYSAREEKNREDLLEEYKRLSYNSNVHLEVYRVNNEFKHKIW